MGMAYLQESNFVTAILWNQYINISIARASAGKLPSDNTIIVIVFPGFTSKDECPATESSPKTPFFLS